MDEKFANTVHSVKTAVSTFLSELQAPKVNREDLMEKMLVEREESMKSRAAYIIKAFSSEPSGDIVGDYLKGVDPKSITVERLTLSDNQGTHIDVVAKIPGRNSGPDILLVPNSNIADAMCDLGTGTAGGACYSPEGVDNREKSIVVRTSGLDLSAPGLEYYKYEKGTEIAHELQHFKNRNLSLTDGADEVSAFRKECEYLLSHKQKPPFENDMAILQYISDSKAYDDNTLKEAIAYVVNGSESDHLKVMADLKKRK
ncbi:MAG: hypothetical protein PHC51_04650 [bacterium]|nr:hypothetical protein [bacterium]